MHFTPHGADLSYPNEPFRAMLKSMMQTLRGIKAFLTLLFDDSGSLKPVLELSHSLIDSEAFELAILKMRATPEVAAILVERYIAPPYDLDGLLQYPKNSLGYTYACHMRQEGLQPLAPTISIDSDIHYIENRWQQTHDIWHIITGFDTSGIDEIGLQAFYLAQFQLPLAGMLIANALISVTLFQPQALSSLLSAIARGWQMGSNAKPLIAQKWEEAWGKPVAIWRTELNVQPVRPDWFG
jgi:ubiquinone biosynthesis protein COQ4